TNPDPLRTDPVTTIISSCIGCGNCGEVAHAAVLCPSFYQAQVIQNPGWVDRLLNHLRGSVIRFLQRKVAPVSVLDPESADLDDARTSIPTPGTSAVGA
ncbi:MAG: hypothetical protein EBT08_22645, partial [Betaproteobacteria bacterium]|nr:hypothetical protein [Betaproteobacteria bacterium]